VLNPSVVPIHDPALITTLPERTEWYHREGCGHLSVDAFWQMSKVIEVRYDRFLALGDDRAQPLADLAPCARLPRTPARAAMRPMVRTSCSAPSASTSTSAATSSCPGEACSTWPGD